MSADNWQGDTGGLGNLQVDVDHLENIAQYLDTLAAAIRNDLLPYVDSVHDTMVVDLDTGKGSALGSSQILEVGNEADDKLAGRVAGTYHAVHDTLKAMADQFDKASSAVQKREVRSGRVAGKN